MDIASLRFFHHSAALHEAVLLVFVPFPYSDATHFLSYENNHSFSIVPVSEDKMTPQSFDHREEMMTPGME